MFLSVWWKVIATHTFPLCRVGEKFWLVDTCEVLNLVILVFLVLIWQFFSDFFMGMVALDL
jgi:hypothetical protein